jgi:hypothetical protein
VFSLGINSKGHDPAFAGHTFDHPSRSRHENSLANYGRKINGGSENHDLAEIDISSLMSSTPTITQSYLTIRATDKEVGVFYANTNPIEAPAGFGTTLVEALRDFANELVKYNCDATGQELLDPERAKVIQRHYPTMRLKANATMKGILWELNLKGATIQ